MEYLVFDIARILRKSGINVSTSEICDCINALGRLDEAAASDDAFYSIINATMVKTVWGVEYVKKLAELLLGPASAITAGGREGLSAPVTSSMGTGMGRVGKGAPVDVLTDVVPKEDVEILNEMLKGYGFDLELLNGDYPAEALKRYNPRYIDFQEADDLQMQQMSREIEKLGRKLAVRKGRRRRTGTKGRISLYRTIRRSLQTGGIPLELVKMENKLSKPDIWILCDMSNSVRKFSYFILLLSYTMQKRYSNIRSFLFVDKLLEVSEYFRERDWTETLDNIGSLGGYNLTGYSHYGNMFREFAANYLSSLNKNTTVLILGDAKNNWNKVDGSEILGGIRDNAAALYWLNPMNVSLWHSDDCLMGKYIKNCTRAYQCSNISQLEEFISEVL